MAARSDRNSGLFQTPIKLRLRRKVSAPLLPLSTSLPEKRSTAADAASNRAVAAVHRGIGNIQKVAGMAARNDSNSGLFQEPKKLRLRRKTPLKVARVSEEHAVHEVEVGNFELPHHAADEMLHSATENLRYNFEHRALKNGTIQLVALVLMVRKVWFGTRMSK